MAHYTFEHSPADSAGLVRDGVTVFRLSPWVDITQLKSACDLRAGSDEAAQNTADRGDDRRRADLSYGGTAVHAIANSPIAREHAAHGRAQHTCFGVSGNVAGNTGVGFGTAFHEDAAKVVPPIGFNNEMTVAPGSKARAKRDHQ